MFIKVFGWRLLFLFALIMVVSGHFPQYCSECEEEIWEEVPCDTITRLTTVYYRTTVPSTIPSTTTPTVTETTTSTPGTTIPTTTPTTTTIYITTTPSTTATTTTTTAYTITNTTTTPSTINSTASDGSESFRKCYCECKVGCREFCRKVLINNDPRKQITQISQTLEQISDGHIEVNHLHQHKYIPSVYNVPSSYPARPYIQNAKPYSHSLIFNNQPQLQQQPVATYPEENSMELDNIYEPKKPASSSIYVGAKTSSYYPHAIVETSGTVDDLKSLLYSVNAAKENIGKPIPYYTIPLKKGSYLQNQIPSPTPPVPPYPVKPKKIINQAVPVIKKPIPYQSTVRPPKIYSRPPYSNSISKVAYSSSSSPEYKPLPPKPCYKKLNPSIINNNKPIVDYSLDNYIKDYITANSMTVKSYLPQSAYSVMYA